MGRCRHTTWVWHGTCPVAVPPTYAAAGCRQHVSKKAHQVTATGSPRLCAFAKLRVEKEARLAGALACMGGGCGVGGGEQDACALA